jgi:hypothetical protein
VQSSRTRAFGIIAFVAGCAVYDPTLSQGQLAHDGGDPSTSTGFVSGTLAGVGSAAGTGANGGGAGAAGSLTVGGSAGLGGSTVASAGGQAGVAGADAGVADAPGGSGGRSTGGAAGSSGGSGSGGRIVEAGPPPCPTGILLTGENNTAQHGGSDPNDMHYKDVCPLGGPVIGYTGSIDSTSPTSVGKIATVCGKLAVDASCRVTVSAGSTMPMRGTVGDVPFTQACPANQVVVGFQGQSGTFLDQVAFTCAPLIISSGPMGYRLSVGPMTTLPPAGGNGGSAFRDVCPAGQIAHGTNVSTTSGIVDAVGLICGAFSLTGP